MQEKLPLEFSFAPNVSSRCHHGVLHETKIEILKDDSLYKKFAMNNLEFSKNVNFFETLLM